MASRKKSVCLIHLYYLTNLQQLPYPSLSRNLPNAPCACWLMRQWQGISNLLCRLQCGQDICSNRLWALAAATTEQKCQWSLCMSFNYPEFWNKEFKRFMICPQISSALECMMFCWGSDIFVVLTTYTELSLFDFNFNLIYLFWMGK